MIREKDTDIRAKDREINDLKRRLQELEGKLGGKKIEDLLKDYDKLKKA